jgi:hypothetical protein
MTRSSHHGHEKKGGENEMELGDIVVIDHPRHPFNGCMGRVVGRRGNRTLDDLWILIYIASKMRSYLVPESILRLEKKKPESVTEAIH